MTSQPQELVPWAPEVPGSSVGKEYKLWWPWWFRERNTRVWQGIRSCSLSLQERTKIYRQYTVISRLLVDYWPDFWQSYVEKQAKLGKNHSQGLEWTVLNSQKTTIVTVFRKFIVHAASKSQTSICKNHVKSNSRLNLELPTPKKPKTTNQPYILLYGMCSVNNHIKGYRESMSLYLGWILDYLFY